MFVKTYAVALVIILGSILLGRAICIAAGGKGRWSVAPAVGLSALIIVSGATIKLPGKSVTAALAVALCIAASAIFLTRREAFGVPRSLHLRRGNVVVVVISLLWASLPFLANGRVGLQGVSLDNDTDYHLLWAETLRSPAMAKIWGVPSGYPLGPHSLVATLGTAMGTPLDLAFSGLLLATVAVTALSAAGYVADEQLWQRVLVGVLASVAYLAAAYYGEGAFKETIMGLLVLAFVVHAEQVQVGWSAMSVAMRWRSMIPVVLLVAGAVYTYSYLGLAWFVAASLIWGVAEVVRHPSILRGGISRFRPNASLRWIAGTAVIAAIVLVPVAGQAISFFQQVGTNPASSGAIPATALGNLRGPLSPYEILGIWPSGDFRGFLGNEFHAGELAAFALAVFLYGIVWYWRRQRLLMAAAAAGCCAIWWISHRSQSPYVTAKALAIGAPLVMALILRALLARDREALSPRLLRVPIAVLFCGLAAYSSFQALRNEPVQAPEAGAELASFHRTIGTASVLFLGDDDYAPWDLRAAAVTALSGDSPSLGEGTTRSNKPWIFGDALDFDSVNPADLDRFRYVITSNSPYASQAPPNFTLLAQRRLYDLWQRTAPTPPREIIEPSGAPAAILDCSTSLGQRLSRTHGYAAVMAAPISVVGIGLLPGGRATVSLPLPAGAWAISIQYVSTFDFELGAQGRTWEMPAYLGRPGPFFYVGNVKGRGTRTPIALTISVNRPSLLTGRSGLLAASIPMIVTTRSPDTRQIVPLSRACGRYVDWYR